MANRFDETVCLHYGVLEVGRLVKSSKIRHEFALERRGANVELSIVESFVSDKLRIFIDRREIFTGKPTEDQRRKGLLIKTEDFLLRVKKTATRTFNIYIDGIKLVPKSKNDVADPLSDLGAKKKSSGFEKFEDRAVAFPSDYSPPEQQEKKTRNSSLIALKFLRNNSRPELPPHRGASAEFEYLAPTPGKKEPTNKKFRDIFETSKGQLPGGATDRPTRSGNAWWREGAGNEAFSSRRTKINSSDQNTNLNLLSLKFNPQTSEASSLKTQFLSLQVNNLQPKASGSVYDCLDLNRATKKKDSSQNESVQFV